MTMHEHWTTPAEAADSLDARLIELYGEVRKILGSIEGRHLSDEETDRLSDEALVLEFEMAKIPAHTPAGMLAKAMIASDNICSGANSDEANMLSLLDDLRRLTGTNVVAFPS